MNVCNFSRVLREGPNGTWLFWCVLCSCTKSTKQGLATDNLLIGILWDISSKSGPACLRTYECSFINLIQSCIWLGCCNCILMIPIIMIPIVRYHCTNIDCYIWWLILVQQGAVLCTSVSEPAKAPNALSWKWVHSPCLCHKIYSFISLHQNCGMFLSVFPSNIHLYPSSSFLFGRYEEDTYFG